MRTTSLLGLLTGLALVAATPVASYAGTTDQAVTGQTFTTDASGWTATATYGGLCLPQLLCPEVSSAYVASGGSGGAADGYLRTGFSSLANTALGTSSGTWESPAFAYDGVGGAQPTSVSVDLSRRAQLAPLLPVDLANTSSFRVDLVDQSTATAVNVLATRTLPLDTTWTAVPTISVNPALLTIGHDYTLRVTTSYQSLATVTAAGEVGYDDVRVSATRVTTEPPVTPEPPVIIYPQPVPPTPTPVVPDVLGIKSTRELRQLVRTVGLPGTAKIVRNHVKLKVTCPPQASPKSCKYAVQGLRDGKGSPATTGRTVLTVQPGQTRTVNLKIRKAFVGRYAHARKFTVRAKVRVGVFKVTVVKKVRLR